MTNEKQTISNLRKLKSFHNGSYGADIDRAIKALEKEDVLDKIMMEIKAMNNLDYVKPVTVEEILRIINKYSGDEK